MLLSWILGVLWLGFLAAGIARGRRHFGQPLKPVAAPITEGWGMFPRYGDQYINLNLGGLLVTLLVTAVGMALLFAALNFDDIRQAAGSNSFLVYALGVLVLLAIAALLAAVRARSNFKALSQQVPAGNCLVSFQKPMALHESAIFTLTFGTGESHNDTQEIGEAVDGGADLPDEVPQESGGRLKGIFYALPRRARGVLQIHPRAPAFKVTPELREIRVPIRQEAHQVKFVVQAIQVGKQAFMFDLSLGSRRVGGFEATIPVRSLGLERALRLAQLVAPVATVTTIGLKVLGVID